MKFFRIDFSPLERKSHHANLLAGFTLVELMIVLAIVGVLAAVAGITLNRQMPKYRLKGDARSITSSLMLARMKATSSGLQHAIRFDLGASPQKYKLQKGTSNINSNYARVSSADSKEMSTGIRIDRVVNNGADTGTNASGTVTVEFNPNGSYESAAPGIIFIELGNSDDGYRIILTPATGRVQTIKGW